MKYIAFFCAALLMAFSSCTKEEPPPEIDHYTIGVVLTGLPFAAQDEAGNLIGIEPELLQRLEKDEGCVIEMKVIERDQVEELLASGAINGAIWRLEHKSIGEDGPFVFTDPYLSLYQTILLPVDSDIERIADLEGHRIGVREGSNAEELLAERQDLFLRRFPTNDECVETLLKGELDAVMMNNIPAEKYLAAHEGVLDELPDTFAMRNYALLAKNGERSVSWTFDSQLFRLRGIGFVTELRKKYQSYFDESFK